MSDETPNFTLTYSWTSTVWGSLYEAVSSSRNESVDGAAWWSGEVTGSAVEEAGWEDSDHPGLQDFLGEVGEA
jgi:hypothetical protein